MSNSILLVEDDKDIRELIKMQLEINEYSVVCCQSGHEAVEYIKANKEFSLFILDWMLPGKSGIELCGLIRENKSYASTPILMVTAKTTPEDIIRGLEAGADDYLTKPFDVNILKARVRALLRRNERLQSSREGETEAISFGELRVDKRQVKVWVESNELSLTSSEYKILLQLIEDPGTVYSRSEIYNKLQGPDTFATERTIDTHIAGLRKKMGQASSMIETIRGVGYRFVEQET